MTSLGSAALFVGLQILWVIFASEVLHASTATWFCGLLLLAAAQIAVNTIALGRRP